MHFVYNLQKCLEIEREWNALNHHLIFIYMMNVYDKLWHYTITKKKTSIFS